MEWQITWSGDPEDLLVRTSGVASLDGLDALSQELLTDQRFRPDLRVLIDHSDLSFTNLTREDFSLRIDAVDREQRPSGLKIAVVSQRKADYGLLRMLGTRIAERTGNEYRVFYTLTAARAWLRE